MPDVMMAVLDKGITRSGEQSEDSKSYHVSYYRNIFYKSSELRTEPRILTISIHRSSMTFGVWMDRMKKILSIFWMWVFFEYFIFWFISKYFSSSWSKTREKNCCLILCVSSTWKPNGKFSTSLELRLVFWECSKFRIIFL